MFFQEMLLDSKGPRKKYATHNIEIFDLSPPMSHLLIIRHEPPPPCQSLPKK